MAADLDSLLFSRFARLTDWIRTVGSVVVVVVVSGTVVVVSASVVVVVVVSGMVVVVVSGMVVVVVSGMVVVGAVVDGALTGLDSLSGRLVTCASSSGVPDMARPCASAGNLLPTVSKFRS